MRNRTARSRLTDLFASSCTRPENLRLLLQEVTKELGFEYFALLHHRCVRFGSDRLIRLDNDRSAWEEELLTRHDVAADPVHLASLRTNAGFGWDELGKLQALIAPQRQILERSGHHGLGPGFTVPANVPGESSWSSSSSGSRPECLR